MYSKHHAAVSLVVAGALALLLEPFALLGYELSPAVVVAYGTAVGVLVDLDHFLIARANTGDWAAVRFCLSNPGAAVADQSRIFDRGDVGTLSRLLSHLLIAGVAVGLLALVSVSLAILTAVVLYAHVVADVAWDVRRLGGEADQRNVELAQELQ